MKAWLQKSPLTLFIIMFFFRMLTTLPVLKGLTALGVGFDTAKLISQVPTVLFVGWLVAWFGWWQRTGLTSARWRLGGLDLAMLALPLLLFLGTVGLDLQPPHMAAVPWLLGDALMVAVWEEIYFRGLMLVQLDDRYPRYAAIIAALAFGLAHGTNGVLGATVTFTVVQVLYNIFCAVGMVGVRMRTGSLWPLIIAHFAEDGLERLVANGQAVDAPARLLVLMIIIGLIYGAYGLWAIRSVRREATGPSVPVN